MSQAFRGLWMRLKKSDLKKIIQKHSTPVLSEDHDLEHTLEQLVQAGMDDEMVVLIPSKEELQAVGLGDPHRNDKLFQCLVRRIGMLRSLHIWFHAAHHVTRGTGFAGDHAQLYGTIYLGFQAEVDPAVEKAIGLTGSEHAACPKMHVEIASDIMAEYPAPHELDAADIASVGCDMIKEYLGFLEEAYDVLEAEGHMTLGLDDQLGAASNSAETYLYLLMQRSKV